MEKSRSSMRLNTPSLKMILFEVFQAKSLHNKRRTASVKANNTSML